MPETKTYHLTNKELINHLSTRDDLNALESDLLDRLICAVKEFESLEWQRARVVATS